MRYILFPTLAFMLGLSLPTEGKTGVIKTSIVSNYRVGETGKIDIDLDVHNKGTATAYHVVATVFIAGWAQRPDGFGDNPPGGKMHFRAEFVNPELKPGNYRGVVRINFVEQGGRPHRVYHIFDISYRANQAKKAKKRLSLELKSPTINSKAFWKPKGKIQLVMKNAYQDSLKLFVSFYLPDGLTTPEPSRSYELSPEERKVEDFPLTVKPLLVENRTYHAVVWYEKNGIHHSRHLQGEISVVEEPAFFWLYVVFGAVVLTAVLGVIYFRERRNQGSQRPPNGLPNAQMSGLHIQFIL